jgi:3-methylfumaryl-CoA hydratase
MASEHTPTRWIGAQQAVDDAMPPFPAHALAALVGRAEAVAGALPLPWHWLYALTAPAPGTTGEDGHPMRGGFLPPVALPRRMWAASEMAVTRPLHLGTPATRSSTVAAIEEKTGRSGTLVFVTVDHRWTQAGADCLTERQTIVYREPAAPGAPETAPPVAPDPETLRRTLVPDAVMLFRYSALTYNAHRIHYDLPYARGVEGYPGLVVHGPLIATLLVEAATDLVAGRSVRGFSFRAERPAFADTALHLHAREEARGLALWSTDAGGRVGMRARLDLA